MGAPGPVRWACALIALPALLGCAPPLPSAVSNAAAGANSLTVPQTADALRALASGNSFQFNDTRYGTQVEHYAPNGTAYLWYPGAEAAISGAWRLDSPSDAGPPRVCFRYDAPADLPGFPAQADRWTCRSAGRVAQSVTAIFAGDPFNLAAGTVPRALPRGTPFSTSRLLAFAPGTENARLIYLAAP